MSLLRVSWKSCSNRSTADCQFGEGLFLSEAFSPFFRNAMGNSSEVFFPVCFLINIKALSLRPEMARGNIPVGVCVLLLFPVGCGESPCLDALGV